jgi:hypothetical protein
VIAISISEANSSGVKSFGAWTVILNSQLNRAGPLVSKGENELGAWCGGSEVLLIFAATPSRELLNRNHTRFIVF